MWAPPLFSKLIIFSLFFSIFFQVAIPVVPTVRVVITFTKFVELPPAEDFYTPLSSPGQFANGRGNAEESTSGGDSGGYFSFSSSWLRGGSRHQSGRHPLQQDPFAIPSGYSWSSFDDKNRKMRKSKSTRRTK